MTTDKLANGWSMRENQRGNAILNGEVPILALHSTYTKRTRVSEIGANNDSQRGRLFPLTLPEKIIRCSFETNQCNRNKANKRRLVWN